MVRSSWDNLILQRIWIKILVLNSIFWLYLSDTTCIMYVMTLNFPSHSPFTITEKMLISCWYPYIVLVSYTVYLHLQGMKVSDKLSSTIAINLDHYPFLHQDLQQIIIQTEDQLCMSERTKTDHDFQLKLWGLLSPCQQALSIDYEAYAQKCMDMKLLLI